MSDTPYIEVITHLEFQINHECKEAWRHLANSHYYGSHKIPFGVKLSEIPRELKDAHWRINSGKMIEAAFRLYADGSVENIPIQSLSENSSHKNERP